MSRCRTTHLVAAVFTASLAITTTTHSATAASRPQNVLDLSTDVAVSITAPDSVRGGTNFRAVLTIANLGSSHARSVTCRVGAPRLDAVSRFRIGVASRPYVEPVEGSFSREFSIDKLRAGTTQIVELSGATIHGGRRADFAVSAQCLPERVDALQGNNAVRVVVGLNDNTEAF